MLVLVLDITSKKQKNMLNFIKPVPVIITTFLTLMGLLMHDMHIDKATVVAVSLPAVVASSGALEKSINPSYHTHVERVSVGSAFRSTMPNMHPPRDDDRRYIQNKKLLFMGGGDTQSFWPSV
jgi:hypothetical protein